MSLLTKRALADALKRLLSTKSLDKVTVTDIAEECGVNRQTFYYHFKDIYDLVEWICLDEAARAIGDHKTSDTWQEGFLRLLHTILENKSFTVKVYHSISRDKMERFLYDVTHRLIMDVVEEKSAGMHISDADKSFVADFYKYAFVGMALDWVRDGMKGAPEIIVDKLGILIAGDISEALKKFDTGC